MPNLTITATGLFGPLTGLKVLANVPHIIRGLGQSNYAGPSSTGIANYTGPYPSNVLGYKNGSGLVSLATSETFSSKPRPMLYTALLLADAYPDRQFIIVESGAGGAGFKTGQLAPGGTLRNTFVAEQQAATAFLKATYDRVVEMGLVYYQGESDGDNPTYQTQLEALLNEADVNAETQLHRHIVRVHENASTGSDLSGVFDAHNALADSLITVDDIPQDTDNLHFTIEGYQEIGRRIYDSLLGYPLTQLVYPEPDPDPEPELFSRTILPDDPEVETTNVTIVNYSETNGERVLDYDHNKNPQWCQFTLAIPRTGTYRLSTFYYLGSQNDRPLNLTVDGTQIGDTIPFSFTGGWAVLGSEVRDIPLTAGTRQIRLTAASPTTSGAGLLRFELQELAA